MNTFYFDDELRNWVLAYVTGTCSVLWCDRQFCIYRLRGDGPWVAQDVVSGAKRIL